MYQVMGLKNIMFYLQNVHLYPVLLAWVSRKWVICPNGLPLASLQMICQ